MTTPVDLRAFLHAAGGRGPAVGLLPTDTLTGVPAGYRVRSVDGAATTTRAGFYTAFADAWEFPDYFGRNAAAFDDCMRDLDGLDDPSSAPTGYLTHIADAQLLLSRDHDTFDWFADSIAFYRDHYRDAFARSVTGHRAVFAVVLSAPVRHHDALRSRWRAAGVHLVTITDAEPGEE